MLLLVLAALGGLPARSAPRVLLEAWVEPELQTVHGELQLVDGEGLHLTEALSRLPIPADDQLRRLTFPGPVEEGRFHLEPVGEGRWVFHAILPRRYGAAGVVPGRGLFANGLWHPQPMQGDTLATVEWDAVVHLPAEHTGVLNRAVGMRTLRWKGEADRLSLAVLPDARVSELPMAAGRVVLVEQGPTQVRRDQHLAAVARDDWPGPAAPDLVLVETPSRRRLARPGPGVLFLSDRAFRVSGKLRAFHTQAVRVGTYGAGLPLTDPWLRAFAAAALADAAAESDADLRELLGWVSWIPQIDDLLYSGRLPFYGEVFSEAWPADGVQDDLQELLDPLTPAAAVTRRIDLRYGAGTAERLAWALLQGRSLLEACASVGVPADALLVWRSRPPPEALRLDVQPAADAGWSITVHRTGGDTTPAEPIVIRVDDEDHIWQAGPGDARTTLQQGDRPRVVQVDPDGLVQQSDRSDDRWPTRWTTIAYLWWDDLSLRAGLSAGGNLVFRRQFATRNRFGLTAALSPQDTASGRFTWFHHFGPLQDRRARPYTVWLGGGPALLRPDFRPVDGGRLAVDLSTGASWDARVDRVFPRQGHRLAVGFGAGQVIESQQRWTRVGVSATKVQGILGRLAVAGRVSGGLASGDVEHRLLGLGGSGAVQGLLPSAAVGQRRAVGSLELRWQPVRFASAPLPLVWLSDVQLHGGLDAGLLDGAIDASAACARGACPSRAQAVGWTGGAAFVGDVFGARPTLLGVWLAGPAWTSAPQLVLPDARLQAYARLTQAF